MSYRESESGFGTEVENTEPMFYVVEQGWIPRILTDPARVQPSLLPLEASVAAHVNGRRGISEIAARVKLSDIEVQVVLRDLADRRVLGFSTGASPNSAANARSAPSIGFVTRRGTLDDGPGSDVPETVMQRANTLERKGDLDGAVKLIERTIARLKDSAALHNKLALIQVQRQEFAEAERLLRRACELEPRNEAYAKNLFKVLGRAAASSNDVPKSSGLIGRLFKGKG